MSDSLISFSEYIFVKYMLELDDFLLRESGGTIVNGTRGIRLTECREEEMYAVEGLIHYSALVVPKYGKQARKEKIIRVRAEIDESNIDCSFDLRGRLSEKKGALKLDDYLIPRMNMRRVSRTAQEILSACYPFDEYVSPEKLAEKLGLGIIYLPLRDMPHARSLLVSEDTRLGVARNGGGEDVDVSERTIVINTSIENYQVFEAAFIAHECFHFAGQRLFNCFQKLARRQYPRLSGGENQASALGWLEWQAHIGGSFLRYPAKVCRYDVEALEDKIEAANEGLYWEEIIRRIASARSMPISLVRRVIIYTGHTAAKGAFCRVNRQYLPAFGFDTHECKGGATYVVSYAELLRLYSENAALREGLRNRALVYVEGHVCVNSPEFVCEDALTPIARAWVDTCCVRFVRDYRSKSGAYTSGILTFDDSRLNSLTRLSASGRLVDFAFNMSERLRALPAGFAETLRAHRVEMGLSQEALAEAAEVERRTVSRIELRKTKDYPFETVLKLAIALRLSPPLAQDFFQKARYCADSSPAGIILEFIIAHVDRMSVEIGREIAGQYAAAAQSLTAGEARKLAASVV